ncbi:6,7-dimethyl-8-ribityllumazine synthase [Persicirhabdus sediminis]|uniref:6,7-dimethyl-8-ribityllumazine synthase n=1 Tax=Persicirhabdus sediminis TaxID=454144 RepID=A0A8J7MEI4_9BACT|nr:6,7-dimethyl-8-ribityllumazine synthase [Persicirhabdus sediminis]MBK1790369.1 6,7-dimethyl-8-ribityllumazine synthase [Persicirhabdus sediminis]
MSTALPPKPRHRGARSHVLIVASEYNQEFTDALVTNTQEELDELLGSGRCDLVRVPGAFEIPAVAEAFIAEEKPDVVIALGLILRGQTMHGDHIASTVTETLMEMSVRHRMPIIHEVLLVEDEKQAYARCIGSKLNRGREAARSAVRALDTFAQLKRTSTRHFPSNA